MDGSRNVRAWSALLATTRDFFRERGYFEVSTDHLVPAGAFEGTIDPLRVAYRGGSAELHTSPEIEMKRILSRCHDNIFQICHCFRDDLPSDVHLREFHMLEYYRQGVGYEALITETRGLFDRLAGRSLPFREITVARLFHSMTHLDLGSLSDAHDFREAVIGLGIQVSPSDDWADLFFRVMIERIEPALEAEFPLIVRDYPRPLAALAAFDASGSHAERFEIYWKGMELCNGASELTDSKELERRLGAERAARLARGLVPHPEPSRLLESLRAGLPRCSGVAVGLDRLFRAIHG